MRLYMKRTFVLLLFLASLTTAIGIDYAIRNNVTPGSDLIWNLGTPLKRWKTGHIDTIFGRYVHATAQRSDTANRTDSLFSQAGYVHGNNFIRNDILDTARMGMYVGGFNDCGAYPPRFDSAGNFYVGSPLVVGPNGVNHRKVIIEPGNAYDIDITTNGFSGGAYPFSIYDIGDDTASYWYIYDEWGGAPVIYTSFPYHIYGAKNYTNRLREWNLIKVVDSLGFPRFSVCDTAPYSPIMTYTKAGVLASKFGQRCSTRYIVSDSVVAEYQIKLGDSIIAYFVGAATRLVATTVSASGVYIGGALGRWISADGDLNFDVDIDSDADFRIYPQSGGGGKRDSCNTAVRHVYRTIGGLSSGIVAWTSTRQATSIPGLASTCAATVTTDSTAGRALGGHALSCWTKTDSLIVLDASLAATPAGNFSYKIEWK